MVRALRARGMSALGLPSPIGATQAILRRSVRVVVIDIFLPEMRGDKLAALFRKNQRLSELKLVLVSGDPDLLARLAKEAKADAALPKTAGEEALAQLVTRLLDRS
jgi:CheY-like chemotaxis protein